MSANEFAGLETKLELVPGEVYGLRSFGVDHLGRLTGVSYRKIWTPGANEAQCLAKNRSGGIVGATTAIPSASYPPGMTVTWTSDSVTGRRPEPEVPKHDWANCQCGFYAYYDGNNDYNDASRVNGIVQGYGETLIGTRGFRCMKAKIVALHIPSQVAIDAYFGEQGHEPISRIARDRIMRNYKDIPFFNSVRDMLAEFPTYGGYEELTPENDPNFWTRWAEY